jgi:hypothetical protein
MAVRWFGVYQETRVLRLAAAAELAAERASWGSMSGNGWQYQGDTTPTSLARPTATLVRQPEIGPPERNFPLSVVIGHGLFASTTIALVLLTAFGVGGS